MLWTEDTVDGNNRVVGHKFHLAIGECERFKVEIPVERRGVVWCGECVDEKIVVVFVPVFQIFDSCVGLSKLDGSETDA